MSVYVGHVAGFEGSLRRAAPLAGVAAEALRAAFAAVLPASAPAAVLETRFKGYAFATLTVEGEAELLGVIEALDGKVSLCGGAPLNPAGRTGLRGRGLLG